MGTAMSKTRMMLTLIIGLALGVGADVTTNVWINPAGGDWSDPANWQGGATWKYRAGVGTSPANPARWEDPANWLGGEPPSGETAIATFDADEPHSKETVWVKLPDDFAVQLGGMVQKANAPKFRFIGGKGFYFINVPGDDRNSSGGAKLKADANYRSIIYSPTRVKYFLDLQGISLACPLAFDRTDATQLIFNWPNSDLMDNLYACRGGEEREFCPGLEYLRLRHAVRVLVPENNDAHTGAWVATAGAKMLKWVSGTKGMKLAVGQYVHAAGVIPEGAYVERLYTDDYIEISKPALVSSADPKAGTSIAFDHCHYKLTQRLKRLDEYGVGSLNATLRDGDNVAAIHADVFQSSASRFVSLAYPGHKYWDNGESESAIDKFPQPARLQVGDMSKFAGGIIVSSGYLALTNTAPGKADIPKLKFGTAFDGKADRYFRCMFDTAAGVSSTVSSCVNAWTGTIGKKGPGAMTVKTSEPSHYRLRVYDGLFTLDPSAPNATMDKITVKEGGTFRLAENRSLAVSELVVEADGRICITPGVKLAVPKRLAFARGGVIRVEAGATFDAADWDLPNGTVFEGPGTVTGLSADKAVECSFFDGVKVRTTK